MDVVAKRGAQAFLGNGGGCGGGRSCGGGGETGEEKLAEGFGHGFLVCGVEWMDLEEREGGLDSIGLSLEERTERIRDWGRLCRSIYIDVSLVVL